MRERETPPSSIDGYFGETRSMRHAFTRSQKRAIWERDEYVCQYPTSDTTKCAKSDPKAQVHHIVPQLWGDVHLNDTMDYDWNGVLLCYDHHQGEAAGADSVHPDMPAWRMLYRNGDKSAFSRMQQVRRELSEKDIPYWNTQNDDALRTIVKENTSRAKRANNWTFPARKPRAIYRSKHKKAG